MRPMKSAMDDSPRILVVDDEPRAVELLARTLRKVGKVDRAGSGEEGAEKFRASDYITVLLSFDKAELTLTFFYLIFNSLY